MSTISLSKLFLHSSLSFSSIFQTKASNNSIKTQATQGDYWSATVCQSSPILSYWYRWRMHRFSPSRSGGFYGQIAVTKAIENDCILQLRLPTLFSTYKLDKYVKKHINNENSNTINTRKTTAVILISCIDNWVFCYTAWNVKKLSHHLRMRFQEVLASAFVGFPKSR